VITIQNGQIPIFDMPYKYTENSSKVVTLPNCGKPCCLMGEEFECHVHVDMAQRTLNYLLGHHCMKIVNLKY
jgi:hypothetical protein